MKRGDWYRHRRSKELYHVIAVANKAATHPDWPVTVVYEDLHGAIWARPMDEFSDRCDFVIYEPGAIA